MSFDTTNCSKIFSLISLEYTIFSNSPFLLAIRIPDDSLRYIVGYTVEIKKAETDSITVALVHSIAELIASEEVRR